MKREIRFFVSNLRSKRADAASAVSGGGGKAIIDYVMAEDIDGNDMPSLPSRPGTAKRIGAADLPIRSGSATSSSSRSGSAVAQKSESRGSNMSISTADSRGSRDSLADQVESMNGSINITDIGTVVGNIRDALEAECETLLEDIEFLQVSHPSLLCSNARVVKTTLSC